MDGSAFVVSLLVLCLGSLTKQFPQDLQSKTATLNQNENNTDNTTVIKCSTARGIAGSCVDRKICDYSTYAIDLSLYATKDYKRPCAENEACCPFSSQLQITDTKQTWEDDDDLSFDENDKK